MVMNRSIWYNSFVPLISGYSGTTPADVQAGFDAVLDGTPVYFSDLMPSTITAGYVPVVIGDFKQGAILGMRKDIEVAQDNGIQNFLTGVKQFAGVMRFDVNVHDAGTYSSTAALGGSIGGLIIKN
jgi:HK97 family phage major capsid protein